MLWTVFRRVVLGTVVEVLVGEAVGVDLPSAVIEFDRESDFRVPRMDNFMRFKGTFRVALTAPIDEARLRRVEARLRATWPELLSVVDLPVGDRLTAEHAVVTAAAEPRADGRPGLRVSFDLAAD